MNFYISDLHFGHKNIIISDNRPFSSVEEMNETLISNWNSVVTNADKVYVLGDLFWDNRSGKEILPLLKGRLHLIQGNHDKLNTSLRQRFEWIENYAEIDDKSNKIILCHYPIAHWKNADYGTIHLYGHIHQSRDSRPFEEYVGAMKKRSFPYKCYNVGCMMPYMNYTPRTLYEILSSEE